MSQNSNTRGRAYEFAWLNALCRELGRLRPVEIVKNSSYEANRRAWESVSENERAAYSVSAAAALDTAIELEPLLEEDSEEPLLLIPQKDERGTAGDVRDLVMSREDISWEVGLSIKHNHDAVKHSRLSHVLDFGEEWFGSPCTESYWAEVKPVFDFLKAERAKGLTFSRLSDKEHDVYLPLLEAFIGEVQRKYAADPSVARRMIEYLIGVTDYYKIISRDDRKLTLIRSFNVHGTLNQPSRRRASAIVVPVLRLPTRMVALQRKPDSCTTVEMYLDNGWELSFRIHNAEDKIVPSLKFDIQFMGVPPEVLCIECRWSQ